MSLIPAFKIGLWNAWILSLAFLLVTYVLSSLIVSKKAGLFVWPRYTRWEKILNVILVVTMFSPFVYSIFLPLKLGSGWLYAGLPIYLIGMIFVIMTILSFAVAPVDKPLTKGIFRISRNPMYFGWFLVYIGMGIVCASWVFLVVGLAFRNMNDFLITAEERICLEMYGNRYREYMKKTPKWIGIPKLGKS